MCLPTPKWEPANLDPRQAAYFHSKAMLNVVYAGRRSWKTEGSKRRLVRAAISCPHSEGWFFACAPTHQQAKDIYWDDLRALVPDWALATGSRDRDISRSELSIRLRNRSTIRVAGVDKPSRIEGGFWDHGVLDEYPDCKGDVLTEHIMPMLARGGTVDVIGVPCGMNHFHELVQRVEAGDIKDAQSFHWTAEECLHLYLGVEQAQRFLAETRAAMDEDTYRQEWLADFVHQRSVVYYAFSDENVREHAYDPRRTLILCFDFNVEPGTAAVIMEDDTYVGTVHLPGNSYVIDEVNLARNSNTERVTLELLRRYENHQGEVHIFGDPAGGNRGSAQLSGSDWDIVRSMLGRAFGDRLKDFVPRRHPPVRARVAATNARFRSADGTRRLFIHPKCRYTIRDFQGVGWTDAGDIDKTSKELTHLSDSISYFCQEKYSLIEVTSKWSQF